MVLGRANQLALSTLQPEHLQLPDTWEHLHTEPTMPGKAKAHMALEAWRRGAESSLATLSFAIHGQELPGHTLGPGPVAQWVLSGPVWVPQSLSFSSSQVIHGPPHTMTAGSQSPESTLQEDRLPPLPSPRGSHQAQVGSPRETRWSGCLSPASR